MGDRDQMGIRSSGPPLLGRVGKRMQQATQVSTRYDVDQTEVDLLDALQSARSNLDSSTENERPRLRELYLVALKSFSDHVCMKTKHTLLRINDRRARNNDSR